MSVYVVDEIMGRGKTTAMCRFINEASEDARFIFITPLLTEVERIMAECPSRDFKTPQVMGTKLIGAKALLQQGCNIVSTHALFGRFDQEVVDLIQEFGYTLVMDEAACTVSICDITNCDIYLANKNGLVEVDDEQVVTWVDEEYVGRLNIYRDMIKSNNIYAYSDSVWLNMMPLELFSAFKDVYIMTYMFEYQMHRCYFDMMGIDYSYLYIDGDAHDNFKVSDRKAEGRGINYRDKIHILDGRMNDIGDKYHSLSKTWYVRNQHNENAINDVKNNLYNFFHNYAKAKSSDCMWTTYAFDKQRDIDCRKLISGKGYSKGFVQCACKGTNDYRSKTAVAYMMNLFPNANVTGFLSKNGVEVDRDGYALSEMVQWIWRSAIRDGRDISVYIPSKRMRGLLTAWLDIVAKGGDVCELFGE